MVGVFLFSSHLQQQSLSIQFYHPPQIHLLRPLHQQLHCNSLPIRINSRHRQLFDRNVAKLALTAMSLNYFDRNVVKLPSTEMSLNF